MPGKYPSWGKRNTSTGSSVGSAAGGALGAMGGPLVGLAGTIIGGLIGNLFDEKPSWRSEPQVPQVMVPQQGRGLFNPGEGQARLAPASQTEMHRQAIRSLRQKMLQDRMRMMG